MEITKLKDEGRITFMNVIDCKERNNRLKCYAEKTARDLADLNKKIGGDDDASVYEINSDGELIEKVHTVEKVSPLLRKAPPMVKARASAPRASAPPVSDDEGGAAPRGASYAAAAEMAREVETMPPHTAQVMQAPPPVLHVAPLVSLPSEIDIYTWLEANNKMKAREETEGLTILHPDCATFKTFPDFVKWPVPRFAASSAVGPVYCGVCKKALNLMWKAAGSGKIFASCYKGKDGPAKGCVNLVNEPALNFVIQHLPALWQETAALRR